RSAHHAQHYRDAAAAHSRRQCDCWSDHTNPATTVNALLRRRNADAAIVARPDAPDFRGMAETRTVAARNVPCADHLPAPARRRRHAHAPISDERAHDRSAHRDSLSVAVVHATECAEAEGVLLPMRGVRLERATGFEPATKSLGSSYSTN